VVKFQTLFNTKTKKCQIFLISISSKFDEEGKKSYLTLGNTSLKRPRAISTIQLTIVEGTLIETREEAMELMVNETSLTLWKVEVNAYNYNKLLNNGKMQSTTTCG